MIRESINPRAEGGIYGKARLFHMLGDGSMGAPQGHAHTDNDLMSDWASVFANFLVNGKSHYRVGAMYLEFENTATAGDSVAIPDFDVTEGISYYNGLSVSSDRDYLRIPLSGSNVSTTDESQWPVGNVSTFFGISSGISGVHGKTFSNGSNSVVIGGALVVTPSTSDASQDLIMSRLYFEMPEQVAKPSVAEVGLEWVLEMS